jgi:hypothetical protein
MISEYEDRVFSVGAYRIRPHCFTAFIFVRMVFMLGRMRYAPTVIGEIRDPPGPPLLGFLSPDGGNEGGLKTIEGRGRFLGRSRFTESP